MQKRSFLHASSNVELTKYQFWEYCQDTAAAMHYLDFADDLKIQLEELLGLNLDVDTSGDGNEDENENEHETAEEELGGSEENNTKDKNGTAEEELGGSEENNTKDKDKVDNQKAVTEVETEKEKEKEKEANKKKEKEKEIQQKKKMSAMKCETEIEEFDIKSLEFMQRSQSPLWNCKILEMVDGSFMHYHPSVSPYCNIFEAMEHAILSPHPEDGGPLINFVPITRSAVDDDRYDPTAPSTTSGDNKTSTGGGGGGLKSSASKARGMMSSGSKGGMTKSASKAGGMGRSASKAAMSRNMSKSGMSSGLSRNMSKSGGMGRSNSRMIGRQDSRVGAVGVVGAGGSGRQNSTAGLGKQTSRGDVTISRNASSAFSRKLSSTNKDMNRRNSKHDITGSSTNINHLRRGTSKGSKVNINLIGGGSRNNLLHGGSRTNLKRNSSMRKASSKKFDLLKSSSRYG